MRSLRWMLLAMLAVAAAPSWSVLEIAGVKFEEKAKVGAAELVLNGAGLRERLFLKVYAMGLYVPERQRSAQGLLALKGPKRVQIITLRELTAQQFVDALVGGIQKNSTEAELAALKPAIDQFSAVMLSIGVANKGAEVRIDFEPESGTQLVFNAEPKGKPIPGEAFYVALLKIWLGDKPAQDDLKELLLGK